MKRFAAGCSPRASRAPGGLPMTAWLRGRGVDLGAGPRMIMRGWFPVVRYGADRYGDTIPSASKIVIRPGADRTPINVVSVLAGVQPAKKLTRPVKRTGERR